MKERRLIVTWLILTPQRCLSKLMLRVLLVTSFASHAEASHIGPKGKNNENDMIHDSIDPLGLPLLVPTHSP